MKKIANYLLMLLLDILTLIVVYELSIATRVFFSELFGLSPFMPISLQDFSFVIIITLSFLIYEKIYTMRYDFWQETYKIFKALLLAYFVVLAVLMLLKTSFEYSRLFLTLFFLYAMIVLPVMKRLSKSFFYKFPFFKKRIFLVGDAKQVQDFKEEFAKNWYYGIVYDAKRYDTVIISSKGLSLEEIDRKISQYLDEHSSVYVVPYVTSINFANSTIMEYSNIRYNTIEIENKLLRKSNLYIKQLFDWLITLMILPFFSLLHLGITLLIRLDSPGSIFFKQYRLGKNQQIFVCYKYRTMYENSEELLQKYLQEHPEEVAYYEAYHKYKNDPRITKIGRILRATSLDELAQVINVLKGDMSLVGPRPYMLNEVEKLGDKKDFILKVKPGITGLWQVSGRNNLTFKERNELEVWYIKNWSLWADFVILVKTVKVVLSKVGAR
jgi:undecaprenyl-phosphate galactose phosphotransferase